MPSISNKITHAEIRMYRMGTGDCFIIKFFANKKVSFKIMIDCGTWQGKKEKFIPYITDLKKYVDNSVDLLIVTHEHKDHVYVFEACEKLFANGFSIKNTWMAWSENDKEAKTQQWIKDYGEKKKALAKATNKINKAFEDPAFLNQFEFDKEFDSINGARKFFTGAINSFADLQFGISSGDYVGMLKGMKIVKENLAKDKIRYCQPGEIIKNLPGAEGIKFYVLGPPLEWAEVKKESGGIGESYQHNDKLAESDAFAAAILAEDAKSIKNLLPFSTQFVNQSDEESKQKENYEDSNNTWRNIDNDWLNSAGALALRVNSMTNNLSLALAIEFEESGRVMLFPGDAEYGSWESWHNIAWIEPSKNPKVNLTEDLLNRTVFYKVAHHMSHNGTAQRLGMEMMTHNDLSAMATLDYDIISPGWTSTMPNKALVDELLRRTKGRLMIMNENGIHYNKMSNEPLSNQILKARSMMNSKEKEDFNNVYIENPLYLQYTVDAK